MSGLKAGGIVLVENTFTPVLFTEAEKNRKTVWGHKMRSKVVALAIVFSANLSFGASQDKTDASADAKGKATFQRVCTGCHDLDTVTTSRFTQTGWEQKVDDMMSRGADASDDEVSQIVAYLTRHYGKLNINTATPAQMEEMLELTEKDAQAIVAYREHNGNIKDFEQLKSVPGVNADKLQEKRGMIAYVS